MRKLELKLNENSYPIFIGQGALNQEHLMSYISGSQILVVSNPVVAQYYLGRLNQALVGKRCESVILPDGESFKTLETLSLIFDALLKHKFSRNCTLIALGGGVIGDITGFAAASYQRGVNYIQVPTTLLSQVDSSVGGKTGVNHSLGKNMIGAFYQPKAVIIDVDTLDTLPPREFAAGMAEVIKYGLIRDPDFFMWLERNLPAIKKHDKAVLSEMIERCCQIKAEIVAQDEREASLRMILNFGHTFGHAIETVLGHGEILHGEAVAIGMVLALKLSKHLGLIEVSLIERTKALLQAFNLPIQLPQACSTTALIEAMGRDKKKAGDTLRFILLESLGKAVIKDAVSLHDLEFTLKA